MSSHSNSGGVAHVTGVASAGGSGADDPADDDPILLAAAAVVHDLGPRRATLTEVARRAGVSRMTLYRRFGSRDRLVSQMLTGTLRRLITPPPPGGESARQDLVAHVVNLAAQVESHPLFHRVRELDPEWLAPFMTRRFGATQRAAAQMLDSALRGGMAGRGGDGSVRDGDPDVMAMACLTLTQAFVFAGAALSATAAGRRARSELGPALDSYLAVRT